MNRKILKIIVDLILITGVLAITDLISLKLFHTESFWITLVIYVCVYAVVFGIRRGIVTLWSRSTGQKNSNNI